MNNTYFNSDNTTSENKEETAFNKLKELAQECWKLLDNEEFIAEFNEEYPELSILFKPVQGLMGISDGVLKFAKDMTFGLGSDVLGMLSYEYKGLVEQV